MDLTNRDTSARHKFYHNTDWFKDFGAQLVSFPKAFSLDDTVEFEADSLMLRVYCYQPNGRTAVHVKIDNGEPVPDTCKAEFAISTWPGSINRLGQQLMALDLDTSPDVHWILE